MKSSFINWNKHISSKRELQKIIYLIMYTKTFLETCQRSQVERFTKIFNGFYRLIIVSQIAPLRFECTRYWHGTSIILASIRKWWKYSLKYPNGRRSRPKVFCEKVALEKFAKFTGKHLSQSLFFNKIAGRPATFLKKRLWSRCFPVNFGKFLRAPFFTEHIQWLLLKETAFKNVSGQLIVSFAFNHTEKDPFIYY